MFGFLKKKLKDVFSKTEKELQQEAKEEEKELKTEIKGIEKEKKEVKEIKVVEKVEELERKRAGLLTRLKKAVTTTKLSEDAFDKFFSELEIVLIENNVALEAIDFLKAELKKDLVGMEIKKGRVEPEIRKNLEKSISSLLVEPFDLVEKVKEKISKEKPYVIVFFGINGSGKTTTIARLCYLLQHKDLSCVLAASDTFRAGAEEQLQKWANELKVKMVKHKYGADPAAVAFDGVQMAKARGIDVVLVDTAGRMHTKADLMNEMKKIVRVAKPDLKLFVGEAIAGNDAIEQVRAFDEAIGIDAIILTKADVDERGGATISASYVTKKPILYLGIGQKLTDLEPFDGKKIIENIF